MERSELEKYIVETYNADPEFPWAKFPQYMVFRHKSNKKWFALILDVPKEKLGLRESGILNVLNLKCDPILIGDLRKEPGFFPAYHMSKESWITVALDGTVDDERMKTLIDLSYRLTAPKAKRKGAQQNDPDR